MKLIIYLSNGLEVETPEMNEDQFESMRGQITSADQLWIGILDDNSREGNGTLVINNREVAMFKQIP